jgi:hypothetical protein
MKTPAKEIPWKLWTHEQAAKLGLTPDALRARIMRGKYPAPKIRKVNQRVWFVVCEQ